MPMPPPPPPAYQILSGAAVWTGRGVQSGQAVVVREGRILAVGPAAKLAKAYPKAHQVGLQGGTLLPGFIEGHAHVVALGALGDEVDLAGSQSLPEALEAVGAWAKGHPGGWLVGRGWDQNLWPRQAFPRATDLDALLGTRPAFLLRVDGHAAWVDTAALAEAGIDENTPDPPGGRILRDPTGRPTGILLDAAVDLVRKRLPAPAPADLERQILAGLDALRADGFTSVADMGIPAETLAAYRRLDQAHALPIRVFAYLDRDTSLMVQELRQPRDRGTAFFQVQGVKFYLDGALGSRGARLLAPYADDPSTRGLWVTDPAVVQADAMVTLRAGYQPAIHAIGDAANRKALDILAAAEQKAGHPRDLPPRIEHAQIVAPRDVPRFGQLGVVASVQPIHCVDDHAWTAARLGPRRLHEAFPWRALRNGGALLAFGSDAPIANANPFLGIAAAETRQDAAGDPPHGFLPSQRLSRIQAIRAYTSGNARALGRGTVIGTIRKGAVADLLWVQAPILKLSVQELRALRPGRLWVNGVEVPLDHP